MKQHVRICTLVVVLALTSVCLVSVPAQASGGRFSAGFHGTILNHSCDPFNGGQLRLSGSGTATFLGEGRTLRFTLENVAISAPYHVYGCTPWKGGAILSLGNPSVGAIDIQLTSSNITKKCVGGADFTVTGG